jgi:hypothetical protein
VSNTHFTVVPALAAGDPFFAAGQKPLCICLEGWIYLGCMVDDEGDEVFAAYRCRRCGEKGDNGRTNV